MKTFLLFISIFSTAVLNAQVKKVSFKASGLTCSMCSNSIYKALKTLDFIEDIDSDIKTYTFELSFKDDARVDFEKIKYKVEAAGFSISEFKALVNFNNIQIRRGEPVIVDNTSLLFMNAGDELLNGTKLIKIWNKGFVSRKEVKKENVKSFPGVFHVTI